MATAAIVVAVAFAASEDGHQQGNEEAYDAKPRKDDVEESKGEIGGGDDPKVIVPLLGFLFSHGLSCYFMHDTRWAILFANAATDAAVLVDDGVATFEDANGVLGAHLYAYATRHASVLFVLCFVFASGASLFPAGRGCAGEARGLLGRKGCSHGRLLFTYFYICECFRWRGGDAGVWWRWI